MSGFELPSHLDSIPEDVALPEGEQVCRIIAVRMEPCPPELDPEAFSPAWSSLALVNDDRPECAPETVFLRRFGEGKTEMGIHLNNLKLKHLRSQLGTDQINDSLVGRTLHIKKTVKKKPGDDGTPWTNVNIFAD